jgi:hypothetical protein
VPDPCPSCGSALSLGGTFCKGCGYDLDLQVADWQGEGAELPDSDYEEREYQRVLAQEGLADEPGAVSGVPWAVVVIVVLTTVALGVVLVAR